MAYGDRWYSLLSGILMFLVAITGCISTSSYWWSVNDLAYTMRATLWRCRVTMLGFVQEEYSWHDICDRSQVLTKISLGDVDGLCRALPAIRACTFLSLALAFASLSMTVSMWLGAGGGKGSKAKI